MRHIIVWKFPYSSGCDRVRLKFTNSLAEILSLSSASFVLNVDNTSVFMVYLVHLRLLSTKFQVYCLWILTERIRTVPITDEFEDLNSTTTSSVYCGSWQLTFITASHANNFIPPFQNKSGFSLDQHHLNCLNNNFLPMLGTFD